MAGLRFLLRGKISLRLQYALWLIVLLRLLMPFEIGTSDMSLMNVVEQVPVVQEFESFRSVQEMRPLGNDQVEIIYNSDVQNEPPVTEIVTMPEQEYEHKKTVFAIEEVITGIWGAGLVIMLVFFHITNFHFSIRLKRTRKELQTQETVLPVYVTSAVETPCLFGFFHPTIYVTPEVAGNETVLRHAITHELMHYRQHDHIWGFYRSAALCLNWFNPLVWWAAKLSKYDAELACDEAVIRKLGEEERYAYGKTLIEMTRPGRNALLGMATTMTGSKSVLKERIERIAKKPKMAAYTLVAVIVITTVTAVCTMTGAENREFEDWLHTVSPDDIYVRINHESGETASFYTLGSELETLCGILNQIERSDLYQESSSGGTTDYQMLIYYWDEDRDENRENLFHVEDESTIRMTFDAETAEAFGEEGGYWHIHSPELAAFITELVDDKGNELMATAELIRADLDSDGILEVVTAKEEFNGYYPIYVREEDGSLVWETFAGTAHPGWMSLFLYDDGERTCLLRYTPYANQGLASYGYVMFTVSEGEAQVLEEDSVGFELDADSTLTLEVERFLEKVNGYLEKSVLLFSTENGDVVLGPASSQNFMDDIQELLARRSNHGTPSVDIVKAMEAVQAEDILRMDSAGNVTAEALAEALNGAADSMISNEEAAASGYDINQAYYEMRGIYLELSSQLWASNEDLRFDLSCGLTEDIVEVSYGKLNQYHTAYFRDAELYHLVRHRRDYEEIIDMGAFSRFQDILVPQMEQSLETMKTNPGMFWNYEMKRFNRIWSYEEEDGAVVEIYDFDYALLTETPELIGWAGGMYLDSEGNVQGFNGGGQFAVRLRNGKRVGYFFLGNDMSCNPGEDEAFIQEHLYGVLNHSEENGGV